MESHFTAMVAALESAVRLEREALTRVSYLATCFVGSNGVLASDAATGEPARRPLALFLRTAGGEAIVLRCVSPVGVVPRDDRDAIVGIDNAVHKAGFVKVCAVENDQDATYNLTVEADMLFHPDTNQPEEAF